jgi:hypothetical protein
VNPHHQNEQEQKQPPDEQTLQELIDGQEGGTTDVPVVRTNTPRPLSFARSTSKNEQASAASTYPGPADFPIEAPAAPPLPEESDDSESGTPIAAAPMPVPVTSEQTGAMASEFMWLFEYGLEMDGDYLNSSTRLNGQARIYGPAVLKGYRIESVTLQNGQAAITLARGLSPEQEAWGILYRIPRRLSEPSGAEPSALDKAHAAYPFTATPVVAQEMYRKRPVQCTTYMLSASETTRKHGWPFSSVETPFDGSYAERLLEVARRQQLPETYLEELAALVRQERDKPSTKAPARAEQNTEPLPVIVTSSMSEQVTTKTQDTASRPTPNGWLLALALYLVGLLMAALALAVMQTLGYWSQVFNAASFAPLGAPWYMLLYGLLGGCISCIMTLGRPNRPTLPGFVILTWFARPYVGAVLAALAYLALSSGLFVISVVPEQRYAVFSVVGAVAGLCEGWLFFRQK